MRWIALLHRVKKARRRLLISKARAPRPGAKGKRGRRETGEPISPRYRGKRDGDLNNDGKPDGQGNSARLDPNSPEYAYRDTGYVAGSRKELAASMIRSARKSGQRLRATDIDWAELETNGRQAKELITKSNLFGKVDWATLRENGMEPGAGFLIDRVYAAIGKEPSEDSPQARKDYALGLETLRDRLEKARTTKDVTDTIDHIRDEYAGKVLHAEEADKIAALRSNMTELYRAKNEADKPVDALYRVQARADAEHSAAKYAASKRERRGWAIRPEDQKLIEETGAAYETARNAWREALDKTKPLKQAIDAKIQAAAFEIRALESGAALRNKTENPLHRAWGVMGDRLLGVINYRSYNGSKNFAQHVAAAKGGRVTDWSWAEGDEPKAAPKVKKESVAFQLLVADNYERIGGRKVATDSTAALKEKFNLREVQSGNWVLRDVSSAKFHTERSAEAFADLADMIGAEDAQVSLNGRLALAFGARGRGNAGGTAARAHYESVHRVINLTKMGGGGTLAHEWFHSLDNIVAEMEGGVAGVGDFVTEAPDKLADGELRAAVTALRSAMLTGNHRSSLRVSYTALDLKTAKYNIDRTYGAVGLALKIKQAGNVDDAVLAVNDSFARYGANPPRGMKSKQKKWTAMAAAYYDGKEEGGEVEVKAGPLVSSFRREAQKLDNGVAGKYWSQPKEMAARAFQSWVEDKLAAAGRRNDYLSAFADNKYYNDPIFGTEPKPFPAGDERTRINAAFDNFFAVLRRRQTLRKALTWLEQ